MKIDPINTTNQTAFHGLWEKTHERAAGSEGHYNNVRMENCYHPFANESDSSVKAAIESRKYQVLVPTQNEYEFNDVVSKPELGKKLSFTEKEYNAYKGFYGKKLTESMEKIEKELIENGLSHHLNNKKIAAVKRFLHAIKII